MIRHKIYLHLVLEFAHFVEEVHTYIHTWNWVEGVTICVNGLEDQHARLYIRTGPMEHAFFKDRPDVVGSPCGLFHGELDRGEI